MKEPDEHLRAVELKILVLGHVGVGKTSLVQRYCHDHFSKEYKTTIGLDYGTKTVEWKNEFLFSLQLCDISGQERFARLTRVFYQGAAGAIVVFDLNEPESLNKAVEWKKDLDEKLPGLPCILVGNKCDLTSLCPLEDIQFVVRNHHFLSHINTSAKKKVNVRHAVESLIDAMVEEVPRTPRAPPQSPRSAQHQYYDRPSPRYRVKTPPQMEPEPGTIKLGTQPSVPEENECCWLL